MFTHRRHQTAEANHPNFFRIVTALGGNLYSGMCRCPCHDDKRPSLHVESRNAKLLLHCFAGCSQAVLIEHLKGRGLWPNNTPPQSRQERIRAAFRDAGEQIQSRSETKAEAQRLERALAVLHAADPEARHDLAPYLNSRGINKVPGSALFLSARSARRLRRQFPDGGLKGFPAMVLAVERDGEAVGVHVTFLNTDCNAKLKCEKPRLMLGPVKGGHIMLGQPDPEKPLIIGEGVETVLAKMQIDCCIAGIAAMTAVNLPHIDPPLCSEIIIAADNDKSGTGIRYARELARKLTARGQKVRIEFPQRPNNWKGKSYDFADLI